MRFLENISPASLYDKNQGKKLVRVKPSQPLNSKKWNINFLNLNNYIQKTDYITRKLKPANQNNKLSIIKTLCSRSKISHNFKTTLPPNRKVTKSHLRLAEGKKPLPQGQAFLPSFRQHWLRHAFCDSFGSFGGGCDFSSNFGVKFYNSKGQISSDRAAAEIRAGTEIFKLLNSLSKIYQRNTQSFIKTSSLSKVIWFFFNFENIIIFQQLLPITALSYNLDSSNKQSTIKTTESGANWNPSTVTAGGLVDISAGNAAQIVGARIEGNKVNMVANSVLVESLQDYYNSKTTGGGLLGENFQLHCRWSKSLEIHVLKYTKISKALPLLALENFDLRMGFGIGITVDVVTGATTPSFSFSQTQAARSDFLADNFVVKNNLKMLTYCTYAALFRTFFPKNSTTIKPALAACQGSSNANWANFQSAIVGREAVDIKAESLKTVGGLIANINAAGQDGGNLRIYYLPLLF